MITLSRRALLASAVSLAAIQPAGVSVSCGLEESRKAFHRLPSFAGGLSSGRRVLVESTVGFATENLAWLRHWGVSVHEPKVVQGPAWVRFNWPISVMIRDFGRVSPVTGGSVIAWLGNMPVAVRQGPLIVLGSPLGPHVYAGDRDAHDLLDAFLSSPKLE